MFRTFPGEGQVKVKVYDKDDSSVSETVFDNVQSLFNNIWHLLCLSKEPAKE